MPKLTRNCAPLLGMVGGKQRDTMAKPKPVKEPKNYDDPPEEESEDEIESQHSPKYVDSSEDETLANNLQWSNFQGVKGPTTATTSSGHKQNVKGKDAVQGAARTSKPATSRPTRASKRTKTEDVDEDGDDVFNSKKKARTGSEKLAGKVGDHMNKERLIGIGNRTMNRAGYGKKMIDKRRALRDLSDSTSPAKQFKYHDSYESLQSSPVSLKLSQKMDNKDDFSSGLSDPPSSDKSDPPRALGDREKKAKARKGKKTKVPDVSAEPMSQIPVFKMPKGYGEYAPVEMGDFDTAIDGMPVVQERQLDLGMVLCPMCDEQVDEELLKEFSKGTRMVMAQQAKFCRMHKRKTAEKLYVERGYPEIDWTTLGARIERHHDFLKSLILGAESHFASILTENIRTGNARTLLTTREYHTPGYYGLRGMGFMTEMVTETFSRLLRERAPTDTRISGRGYTGFVQSVLVPELAVKLIQEDLSLVRDKAREVMVESRELGEILNDEKRQSQPRPHIDIRQDSPEEEEHEHEESEEDKEDSDKSNDEAPTDLKALEVADSDSALSSPPYHSQRLPSITGETSRRHDENGSDVDIAPRSGQASKNAKAPVKTRDATALPVRASPRNSRITKKSPVPTTLLSDDSDDSDNSGASSGLESI